MKFIQIQARGGLTAEVLITGRILCSQVDGPTTGEGLQHITLMKH